MGAIQVALDTLKLKKQGIVFAESKAAAEKTAEEIAKKLPDTETELAQKVLKVLANPTKQCERLAKCVKKGTAFHHSGLLAKQRELVENGFKEGRIKIICSTPTLAAGLDMPAFRTIMKSLKRYNPNWGMDWIPTLEYQQMAGRAGRPQYDKWGEAISIAKSEGEKTEIEERYVHGESEAITSKLAAEPVLRTIVLGVIAAGFAPNKQKLAEFFSNTFWANQYNDMATLQKLLDKTVELLKSYQFIEKEGEFQSAADIGKETLKATQLGKRVAELYIDPLTANHLIQCLTKASEGNETGLLNMVAYTYEMRPLLRVRVKEHEEVQAFLLQNKMLCEEPTIYDSEYDDFLASVKTTMFLQEWIEEKTEKDILEKYNVRPGEIHAKLYASDWLLYTAHELARMLKLKPLLKELGKLRYRLKHGIKEELIALTQLKNIGRVRARALYNKGYKNLGYLKKAQISELTKIVGAKTAQNIKIQLTGKI